MASQNEAHDHCDSPFERDILSLNHSFAERTNFKAAIYRSHVETAGNGRFCATPVALQLSAAPAVFADPVPKDVSWRESAHP
jgi:hypothetical protein